METAAPTSLSEIRALMAATNDLFNVEVFGKRNFDALDRIYTSTARILPPGAPMISGRPAIKKFWSDMVKGANAKAAVLSSVDVMPADDGVVEIGKALLTVAPLGQPEGQIEMKQIPALVSQ
jgi:ketosteroid isomerase-like protein